jgi:hypothetical protein
MFKWLKKRRSAEQSPATAPHSPANSGSITTDTLKLVSVWDVVDQFLTQNPQPTPYSVHALIDAGAANLLDPPELMQVCEKIQEHGYQYPINGVLLSNLDATELLGFLRWQSKSAVEKSAYDNEATISVLIEHFRAR